MRIAAIADIHSNALALEAVMHDIARQSVDQIVQLGDAFNGPIDARGVANLLRSVPMLHLRGNGERMVLSEDPKERSRSAQLARELLDRATLDWAAGWPMILEQVEYVAFHATPTSDVDYLVEELVPGGTSLRDRQTIARQLQGVKAPLILCGHTHVPQYVRLDDKRAIVNPGSVGLPAYSDPLPIPHRMQTGSPEARYAVIDIEGGGLTVAHRSIRYDYHQAAKLAEAAGFTDWARALSCGYAD